MDSGKEFDTLMDSYHRLGKELDRLAEFILTEIEGEPSQNESAIDTAIRLLCKQIPLKAKGYEERHDYILDGGYGHDTGRCPSCNNHLKSFDNEIYCPYCGQKIDWSGDE